MVPRALIFLLLVLTFGSAIGGQAQSASPGPTTFDVSLTLRRDIHLDEASVLDQCISSSWERSDTVWVWSEFQGIRSECEFGFRHDWPRGAHNITVDFAWYAHPAGTTTETCLPRTVDKRVLTFQAQDEDGEFATKPVYDGADGGDGLSNMSIASGNRERGSVLIAWLAQDGETVDEGTVSLEETTSCSVPVFEIVPTHVWSNIRLLGIQPTTERPIKELARRSDGYELPLTAASDPVFLATHGLMIEIRVPHTEYRLHGIRSATNGIIETPDAPAPTRTEDGVWLRYSGAAALALLENDATLILIDTSTTPIGFFVGQSLGIRGLLFTLPLLALAVCGYDAGRYVHRSGDAQRGRSIAYGSTAITLMTLFAVSSIPTVVQDRLYELERGEPSDALLIGLAGLMLVTIGSLLMVRHMRGNALVRLEQERLQEAAEQHKTAARAEELETFVAGLGHDLKTPLIALDWLTKDVEAELLSGDPEEVRESIGRIRKNVGGMDRLVKDLLELTRIDKGEHDETTVDLRHVLEDVVMTVEDDARRRGTTLHVDHRSLPALTGDRALWRQVFQNLVGNAVKYGRAKDGNVYVRAMRLPTGDVRMEVEDDGPGIPQEEKTTIFEMFRRGSTGASQEGTGLGLALVRKIVEKYGGTIQVEDAEEGGSRFIVDVPASRVTSRIATSVDADPASTETLRASAQGDPSGV